MELNNKSSISYTKYVSMKSKLLVKSYTEKFKWIDRTLYVFSWFGNLVSIFFAFFFLQTLFYSSFNELSNSIIVTGGIVFFLSIFELLKRYVLGLFSVELIKNKFKVFKKNMSSFIISVLVLIMGSFYLSLNGAMDFVDNQTIFTTETTNIITSKIDSITTVYNLQILDFKTENENIRVLNNNLRTKLSETPVNFVSVRNGYQSNIDKNTEIVNQNQNKIDEIEVYKQNETQLIRGEEGDKLSNTLDINFSNMIAFIILSSLIELIIIIGVYYDKLYDYKTIEEYEKTVIETTNFKMWYLYDNIIDVLYSSSKGVGEKLVATNTLLDLLKINSIVITKSEFDRFIKILYSLDILYLDGNRRIVNKTVEEGKLLLKSYFKIK